MSVRITICDSVLRSEVNIAVKGGMHNYGWVRVQYTEVRVHHSFADCINTTCNLHSEVGSSCSMSVLYTVCDMSGVGLHAHWLLAYLASLHLYISNTIRLWFSG